MLIQSYINIMLIIILWIYVNWRRGHPGQPDQKDESWRSVWWPDGYYIQIRKSEIKDPAALVSFHSKLWEEGPLSSYGCSFWLWTPGAESGGGGHFQLCFFASWAVCAFAQSLLCFSSFSFLPGHLPPPSFNMHCICFLIINVICIQVENFENIEEYKVTFNPHCLFLLSTFSLNGIILCVLYSKLLVWIIVKISQCY